MTRYHDFRLERPHHSNGVQRVRNADELTQIIEPLDTHRRCGEKHPLLGQPNRGVSLAVDIFQVVQLEGSIADAEN